MVVVGMGFVSFLGVDFPLVGVGFDFVGVCVEVKSGPKLAKGTNKSNQVNTEKGFKESVEIRVMFN